MTGKLPAGVPAIVTKTATNAGWRIRCYPTTNRAGKPPRPPFLWLKLKRTISFILFLYSIHQTKISGRKSREENLANVALGSLLQVPTFKQIKLQKHLGWMLALRFSPVKCYLWRKQQLVPFLWCDQWGSNFSRMWPFSSLLQMTNVCSLQRSTWHKYFNQRGWKICRSSGLQWGAQCCVSQRTVSGVINN